MLLYRTENWSANQIAATCQAALHVSGHGYTHNVDPQELFLWNFAGSQSAKLKVWHYSGTDEATSMYNL